jgi:hypothetical protein
MMEKLPMISGVRFEQMPDKLKIVLPVKRNWPFLVIYTLLVLMWLGMMVYGVIFLARIILSGASYRFVFAVMIVILLFILFRFGRFLFRQWADYLSNREILFINSEELIVRKPVSIWGNTAVYDMQHVSPFYISDKHSALAFDYGAHHVFIGQGLALEAQGSLRRFLNRIYFPGQPED